MSWRIVAYLRRLRRQRLAFPRYILLGRVEYDLIPSALLPWAAGRQTWLSGN